MSNKTRFVLIHIICSTAFLSLPVFSGPGPGGFLEKLQSAAVLRNLVGYAFALLFFYIHYFWLIPRLYFKRRYGWYFFWILICFVFLTFHPNPFQGDFPPTLPDTFVGQNPALPPPAGPDIFGAVRHNLLRFSLVFFISLLLKTNEQWRETEREKTEAELSFLKAQVNPHFLFNTLNGIYSLAIEKSDDTAEAIAQLSGMMRYVTSEAGNDRVPLERELEYLTNYIELQKIRFDRTVNLDFKISGSHIGKKIAPLILITFIENAFKYGVNPEEDSTIFISIDISSDNLTMEVENKIVQVRPAKEAATSLGIENTRHRLEYMYPDKHDLVIEKRGMHFYVLLKIKL